MLHTRFYKTIWPACLLLLTIALPAQASHMVAGKMSYKYLGNTGTGEQYEVTLTLYADCQNGQPDAIENDNPAYLGVYDKVNNRLITYDTSMRFFSSTVLTRDMLNPCNSVSNICILERQFKTTFLLSPSSNGYIVTYQRCCLNSSLVNIVNPGDNGVTYYCTIPPTTNKNNSAVFRYNAQVAACINENLSMDLSATDADGDSLSYELSNILKGGSPDTIKPFPRPGPFDSLAFNVPSTSQNPLGAAGGMYLDPVTGILTGKPDRIGRYLLAVTCTEWRGGVPISKTYQQFQMLVINCNGLSANARKDTAVLKGATIQFHARGGTKYKWHTSHNLSSDTIANPTASFPETGVFSFVAVISATAGCETTDTIVVHVVEHSDAAMPNAFTPNGDGLNDVFKPEFIGPCTVKYLKVYNRYGNMVYDGIDGWDGKYKGKEQNMQVFAWTMLYENSIGETKLLKGNVTLVR